MSDELKKRFAGRKKPVNLDAEFPVNSLDDSPPISICEGLTRHAEWLWSKGKFTRANEICEIRAKVNELEGKVEIAESRFREAEYMEDEALTKLKAAEAKVARIVAVRNSLATQCLNDHAVKQLDAALSDGEAGETLTKAIGNAAYWQQRAEAAEAKVKRYMLDGGRQLAKVATFMTALAQEARNGRQEWAQEWVKKADAAAAGVKLEDFTVAQLNQAALSDGNDYSA